MAKILKNDLGTWDLDEMLSDNFSLGELTTQAVFMRNCPVEYFEAEMTPEIYHNLRIIANFTQLLRDKFGSITCNCGFRPVKWDKSRGRPGTSRHCKGMAMDIYLNGVTLKTAFEEAKRLFPSFGIAISYKASFIHIDFDVSDPGRRWTY